MRKLKIYQLALQVICLGVWLAPSSCKKVEKDEVTPKYKESSSGLNTLGSTSGDSSSCNYNTQYINFYGGQSILCGTVSVTNDATNLYVTYHTTNGWMIGQTHLYVGALEKLPVNNSNTPVPGHFPYSNTFGTYVTEYSYSIPLSELPPCYIIAAHAEVHKFINGKEVQTETAWSYGTPFPNTNRWGWYSNYCTQKCDAAPVDPPVDPGSDPGREG